MTVALFGPILSSYLQNTIVVYSISAAISDITIAESASHAICYVPHLLLFSLFSLYSLLLSVQFPIANLSDMLFSLTQRG